VGWIVGRQPRSQNRAEKKSDKYQAAGGGEAMPREAVKQGGKPGLSREVFFHMAVNPDDW
jgi:hypothetical protein